MGDPRFRPSVPDPRKCDYGRTNAKPDYTCSGEGLHRWKYGYGAPGQELNLCDPHDAEARRALKDPPPIGKRPEFK